ncbi:MAG: DMT family transporter [Gammaproteobacteria bacterium]|nr:DMT family transporter [Gammaproteobacteria bacterium]
MNKYLLVLLLGVMCLASGGIFVKLSELGPVTTAFYRILLAMPLALLWARCSAAPRPRKGLWNVPRGDFGLLIASGAFLAVDLILWHISFFHTTVANANLLANLVPFVVVPMTWLLFGDRPSGVFTLGLVVAVAGVWLLMAGKIDPSPDNFLGDFLAIATALFYGLYLITVGRLRARYNAGDILFWGGFSSLVILFAVMVVYESPLFPGTLHGVLILVCLAVFSQIGGQGLIAVSFGRLPINFASVAVLMQPVIAAFYAYLLFFERLSMVEIAGTATVLLGIYIAKTGSFETHAKVRAARGEPVARK